MSFNHPKRPRHWAADLVDAWVDRKPAEVIMLAIPANDVDLARTHARIMCQSVVFHAKHTDDLPALGTQMREWVERYREARSKT